ncbi:MAG: aldo/keto reductase family oxidoreductase [Acidimicrobiia bacterium]
MVPAPDSLPLDGPRAIAGRPVGPLGFGCWRLTTASTGEAARLVEGAVDAGCTLVDTADVYGLDWGGSGWGSCEERLGAVLTARPGLRDRMVRATKGGIVPGVPYDSTAAYLAHACEASLRRLGVDHVDLYMIHRPDLLAHPAEVAAALLALRQRGLIGAIGVSNHTPAQIAALEHHLGEPVAAVQPELSVVALDAVRNGVLDRAMHHDTAVLAWSPLAGGRVATGEGVRSELRSVLDRLAATYATTREAVALAFVLAHPARPVALLGTQRLDRIATAVDALSVPLTRADWYAIVEASEGVPLP